MHFHVPPRGPVNREMTVLVGMLDIINCDRTLFLDFLVNFKQLKCPETFSVS